jgi:hypothetical protein
MIFFFEFEPENKIFYVVLQTAFIIETVIFHGKI